MIERIASHLGDFTPRLQSNTRALYQYCPIPMINFPQLDNELFCNMYYLRHLCDTVRFPDWPIREPVSIFFVVLSFVARIYRESCICARLFKWGVEIFEIDLVLKTRLMCSLAVASRPRPSETEWMVKNYSRLRRSISRAARSVDHTDPSVASTICRSHRSIDRAV